MAAIFISFPTTTLQTATSSTSVPSATWITQSIDLFNAPHVTGTPVPSSTSSLLDVGSPSSSPQLNSVALGAWTPNFSRPVLGALLGGVIALIVFLIILIVRRKLIKRRRERIAAMRHRNEALHQQMEEAEAVTRRAVLGDLERGRRSTYR